MKFPENATKEDKQFIIYELIRRLKESIEWDKNRIEEYELAIKYNKDHIRITQNRIGMTLYEIKELEDMKVD